MRDVNRSTLLGRLGADPTTKATVNGPMVRFSLATSRRIPKKNENGEASYVEETTWHNVSVFGTQAENCAKYLKKGSTAYLEGSVRNQLYNTKDGQKRVWSEVRADFVNFLSPPRPMLPQQQDAAVERAIEEVSGKVEAEAEALSA